MPGDALLIGIAQLGIVVAGFTAISVTLLPVITYPALADARSSFVVSSDLVAVYLAGIVLIRVRQIVRARALHARSTQLTLTAAIGSIALFGLDALVFGSLTVYALALCVQLSVAAISFYSLVSTATE